MCATPITWSFHIISTSCVLIHSNLLPPYSYRRLDVSFPRLPLTLHTILLQYAHCGCPRASPVHPSFGQSGFFKCDLAYHIFLHFHYHSLWSLLLVVLFFSLISYSPWSPLIMILTSRCVIFSLCFPESTVTKTIQVDPSLRFSSWKSTILDLLPPAVSQRFPLETFSTLDPPLKIHWFSSWKSTVLDL